MDGEPVFKFGNSGPERLNHPLVCICFVDKLIVTDPGISKDFGTGLIVMASMSFLLTLLQNGGNNLGKIDGCVSRRKKAVIAP